MEPIVPNLKRTVIINAGHWDDPDTPHVDDQGASAHNAVEALEVIKIRDKVLPILARHGIEVYAVPDQIDLRKSIEWANKKAPTIDSGLAIDIHLNYLSNSTARGSESFYGTSDTSKKIAEAITRNVSREMGIPDRGAKPDTQTAVGSLGWIRKTTMWASLIEVCFLTNEADMAVLQGPGGYKKAATGIAKGVLEVFGIEYQEEGSVEPEEDLFVTDASGKRLYKLTKL